jgi:hypothetical protein
MRQIVKCVLSGMGLWLALACGGEGGSGGGDAGELDTGLPEETPLEDVTSEQYTAACEALRDRASSRLGPDKTVRGACEIFTGAFTNDPAECREGADDCVVQANDGTHAFLSAEALDVTQFECVGGANDRAGCTVTVGEFETCMNDRLLAFERLLSENTCNNAAMIDFVSAMNLANFASMDAPASCAQLGAECPAVDPFAAPP